MIFCSFMCIFPASTFPFAYIIVFAQIRLVYTSIGCANLPLNAHAKSNSGYPRSFEHDGKPSQCSWTKQGLYQQVHSPKGRALRDWMLVGYGRSSKTTSVDLSLKGANYYRNSERERREENCRSKPTDPASLASTVLSFRQSYFVRKVRRCIIEC